MIKFNFTLVDFAIFFSFPSDVRDYSEVDRVTFLVAIYLARQKSKWRNNAGIRDITSAIKLLPRNTACFNCGQRIDDHYVDVTKMVDLSSGTKRQVKSAFLSRNACYLIVQNADPGKEIAALAQTIEWALDEKSNLQKMHIAFPTNQYPTAG